jgi:hypothetical protein
MGDSLRLLNVQDGQLAGDVLWGFFVM